jgi:hypothetical protein
MDPDNKRPPGHPIFPCGSGQVALALLASYLGIWVHEFHRVPASWGFTPEGTLSLLVPAIILFLTWWRFPHSVAAHIALGVLGTVHLLGAVVTVFPLPFLPFVPEQTIAHYLVHAVYAAGQILILLVTVHFLRNAHA